MVQAGIYPIKSRLNLKPGIVLRGEGHLVTRLDCVCADGCINVRGSYTGGYIPVLSGFQQGSTQITVSDASGFTAGRGGQIKQDDISVYINFGL